VVLIFVILVFGETRPEADIRVQAILIILLTFQACSYSVSSEVIDIIATQFASVTEDGYVDTYLIDEVHESYIDENGRRFSYAMGLKG
jgi:hypothetical protein